jgi:hypothetical protein
MTFLPRLFLFLVDVSLCPRGLLSSETQFRLAGEGTTPHLQRLIESIAEFRPIPGSFDPDQSLARLIALGSSR